jgi:hypothetical protein
MSGQAACTDVSHRRVVAEAALCVGSIIPSGVGKTPPALSQMDVHGGLSATRGGASRLSLGTIEQ